MPADLANNSCGRHRMQLDSRNESDPYEQARPTTADWSGRPGSRYGSKDRCEGYGAATAELQPRAGRPVGPRLFLVVSRKTRTAGRLPLARDDDHRACRVIHDLSAY